MSKPVKTKHALSVSFTTTDEKRKSRELLAAIREAVAKAVGVEKVVVKTVTE